MAHNNKYTGYRTRVAKYCLCFILSFLAASCSFDDAEPSAIGNSKITISTSGASDITRYTAKIGGSLGDTYGRTVQDYGHCWGTSAEPDLTNPNTLTSLGNQSGNTDFNSNLQGLLIGTWYYARTYFVIDNQTVYGNHIVFRTAPPSLPTVQTVEVREKTTTTAQVHGFVQNDGGSPVFQRGVCFDTIPNPDIMDNRNTINDRGEGSFISYLSGLKINKTYYVKTYASNSAGIAYGNEISFITN